MVVLVLYLVCHILLLVLDVVVLFVLFVVLVNGVNLCKPAKLVDEEDLIFPLMNSMMMN